MMKKLAAAIITSFVIAIAIAIPAISQPYKPLRSQVDLELVWDPVPHWEGMLPKSLLLITLR